jgi:hypothetical protein
MLNLLCILQYKVYTYGRIKPFFTAIRLQYKMAGRGKHVDVNERRLRPVYGTVTTTFFNSSY